MTKYVGPDGMALHPGDRVGIEPPGCAKRDDRIDAMLTAARYIRSEIARCTEVPERMLWGDDLNDKPGARPCGLWMLPTIGLQGGELQLIGKDDRNMTNTITVTWEKPNPEMKPAFATSIETSSVADAKDAAIAVLRSLLEAYVKAGCDRENTVRCMMVDVETGLTSETGMLDGYSILLPYDHREKKAE